MATALLERLFLTIVKCSPITTRGNARTTRARRLPKSGARPIRMIKPKSPPPEPPRRGRPPLDPNALLTERVEVRLTAVQRAKLDLLGGAPWLRSRIEKAKT